MTSSPKKNNNERLLHWGRFLVAIFAILIAATHISSATASSGASRTPSPTTAINQTAPIRAPSSGGFQYLGLWLDIEIVSYTVIAVVFLFGMRSWYIPAVLFNLFNVALYFLSGIVAIPGITSMAFGNRLAGFSFSFNSSVLMVSWIALLVLGFVLLKYDSGSQIDKLYRTSLR